MAIVGGLDIHRRQLTDDDLDTDRGETRRGRLSPATRLELRAWLARLAGQQADVAFAGTTGWRLVAEELMDAGFRAQLAEPADTRALRGPSGAPTPTAPTPPPARAAARWHAARVVDATSHLADARTQVRLRRGLVGEHTGWYQRIHASLFHHGLPERSQLLTADGGAWLGRVELPAVARQAVEVALRMIDHLESNSTPSTPSWLASPGPSQAARRSSGAMDRVADRGGDLGRVRRRAPLRRQPPGSPLLCLDITITESDGKRARGHLARQGAPVLRWALHQAAMCATRPSAPDHAAYLQVRQRLGGKRAALSLAPKLAREASHTLRELGDQALVPAEFPTAA